MRASTTSRTPHVITAAALMLLAPLFATGIAQRPALPQYTEPNVAALRAGFAHPPDDAKPMVRWWWFGPAVVQPEILRELKQMKADGIGGVELAFVYPEVLNEQAKGLVNLPFLSPDMLAAVRYAQQQGHALGLRVDVTLCSGWPYGGPNTSPENAATKLRVAEVDVSADRTAIQVPSLKPHEELLSAALVQGLRGHWSSAGAEVLPLPAAAREVSVAATSGARVAVFFISSHTGQQVKRAAVDAEGPVLDPFSYDAVAQHLAKVGGPLLKAFGSTPPYAIFSDSLEAYGADWTPTLLAEFKRRRGYDLLPHLPELVAGDTPEAANVRHDYGRTLTELVDQNYLTQINDWAHAHGTRFRSQTYGEPAVSLASERLVDLPEGEGPQWRQFSTLRWASSANHLFGNPITSGETFTWLHSPVFRAIPLDMKLEADIDFVSGENQLIFHGWPYSPPPGEVPEPGWSLYAAAALNDHNPWHPVMPAVTGYLTRLSWLLRQGRPANQVALLLPTDDAWAQFRPGRASVTAAMQQLVPKELMDALLSAGYNLDFVDAETLAREGVQHAAVVLPPTQRLPAAALAQLLRYKQRGGTVMAMGHAPTLDGEGHASESFTRDVARLVPSPLASARALAKSLAASVTPDLSMKLEDGASATAVGFVRRKLREADVYFLTNTSNLPVRGRFSFGTKFKSGERWDADTGRVVSAARAADEKLALAPFESAVFIFSNRRASAAAQAPSSNTPARSVDLSHDWTLHFASLNQTEHEPVLRDWTADPKTLHYSGEGVYTHALFWPHDAHAAHAWLALAPGTPLAEDAIESAGPEDTTHNPLKTRTGPGIHAAFAPPVNAAALVYVNGSYAGALWHPPYRLDLARLLHEGANTLELRVYNTALNAWSALPPHDYKPLITRYGDRFQMQDLDRVRPVPSGLVGPVELIVEDRQ